MVICRFLLNPMSILLGLWHIRFAMLSSDSVLTPTDNEIKGLGFLSTVASGY